VTATGTASSEAVRAGGKRQHRGSVWHVYRVERRKLANQLAIRLTALTCLLGPFVFAAVLKLMSGNPTDTLFGVWVHSTGFAVSLVLLAFAGSWGFPLVSGIVAGDMFSGEDRYGTWKMVLTRSCTRGEMFVGKLIAAAVFTLALVALTAVSSLLAGLILVGGHALVGLGGQLLSPGKALGLVLLSWLLCALPALAFTSLAVLFSVASRNGIMGVVGPSLVGLAMQLLLLVGSGIWVHMLLVGSAFNTWHALWGEHRYYGPLVIGLLVSAIWIAVCLGASWLIVSRRDFAGAPVSRRPGWVMPVRAVLVMAGVIALLAIAGNWGPTGVTPHRLQASLTPAFNSLTLLQQRELGRSVPPGSKLNIVPTCSRRGATPDGPGDWVCTMTVYIPQPGAVPFQQTPVTYDVSVQSDGCYKAQSPPSFIGQQTMRAAHGATVVNPLYTIYGCFDTM
jgi:ABC-2 type transport system permease protein